MSASLKEHDLDDEEAPTGVEDSESQQISVEVSNGTFSRAISFPTFKMPMHVSVAELQSSLLITFQTDTSTMIILSLLTQVTMMRISDVTKRPVQQAVVLRHGAAELYHEGFNVTSWDVWIRMVELPGVERGPQHE